IGRFYDFFEKRAGRWAIVRRQPVYEMDRLDPVDPSARITLDGALLNRFPEGYRHLAYLQTKNGFDVRGGLPGLRGEAVEKLYAEGRAWLAGANQPVGRIVYGFVVFRALRYRYNRALLVFSRL